MLIVLKKIALIILVVVCAAVVLLWIGSANQTETTPTQSSLWTRRPDPVFTGQFNVASDPMVLRKGNLYHMYYACLDELAHTAVCLATSQDGISWQEVDTGGPIRGLVLRGKRGSWDEHVETPYVFQRGPEYLLYYIGYTEEKRKQQATNYEIGLARSSDGVHFDRASERPVLSGTRGGYDSDGISSPLVLEHENSLLMVYAAQCYYNCTHDVAGVLAGAKSIDGVNWEKLEKPIFAEGGKINWVRDFVAEPDLIKGPDGSFYLFFTSYHDAAHPGKIGMAKSLFPFGPWEITSVPVVTHIKGEDGVLAPSVLIEGDRVRMWFLGHTPEEHYRIDYAEAPWPLN